MILEIAMLVHGSARIPITEGMNCVCAKYDRAVECSIGTLIHNDEIIKLVFTTDRYKRPITTSVTLECSEQVLH